jgi:hypothetical protein
MAVVDAAGSAPAQTPATPRACFRRTALEQPLLGAGRTTTSRLTAHMTPVLSHTLAQYVAASARYLRTTGVIV